MFNNPLQKDSAKMESRFYARMFYQNFQKGKVRLLVSLLKNGFKITNWLMIMNTECEVYFFHILKISERDLKFVYAD